MNNRYFSPLLCITILTLAPACNKKKSPSIPQAQEEIKTTIELDNTIIEIEEDAVNISKF